MYEPPAKLGDATCLSKQTTSESLPKVSLHGKYSISNSNSGPRRYKTDHTLLEEL